VKTSLQPWQLLFLVLAGWVNHRQQDACGSPELRKVEQSGS